MSEIIIEETIVEDDVSVKIEPIDLVPAKQNTDHKSYLYKVFIDSKTNFIATVISQSSTGAKEGLRNQFPDAAFTYLGTSTFIMQVNG